MVSDLSDSLTIAHFPLSDLSELLMVAYFLVSNLSNLLTSFTKKEGMSKSLIFLKLKNVYKTY